jgi:CheY-like chemotaxis protein
MTKSPPSKSLVLYADDDADDRELVLEAFNNYTESIELITFKDGIELLRYIQSPSAIHRLPCLIILDINMPKMNGKEVLRNLRCMKEYERVPVVLFSTSTLPSEKAFAQSFDAAFLTKPLYTGQIYELVDKMLDHCGEEVKKNIKKFKG